jgi:rare lipoprotein A (peptidoglycan hydrolase)
LRWKYRFIDNLVMKRICLFLTAALFTAAAGAQSPGDPSIFRQEGIASWYGTEFDGRPTASGEFFDPSLHTAAHPTLPFGTLLRVTNLHNGRKANVRINDRGPFVSSRIIDLSQAAAQTLDMLAEGTATVLLEALNIGALSPADLSNFWQDGIASWYGAEFDGRPTASGEIFDSSLYTAAHPFLPLGTLLSVTNLHNGRKANVRINDRGPFVSSRIIDVSRAAAEQLDMVVSGTAPVLVEVLNGGGQRANSTQTGNRYALVIGNAVYQQTPPLENPVTDAGDIAAALRRLGYDVELTFNTTKLDIVDAVEAYAAKLKGGKDNEGFFWYAGHGVQIQGENYLLPVDAAMESESRIRASSYPLNELLGSLENAGKVNVVIIDACRNNPLPQSSRSAGTRGLARVEVAASDLFVMFSTKPGDVAEDGRGKRNSPFTEAFLKCINSTEPVYQMAVDVIRETLDLTDKRQQPFYSGSIISEKYYSLNNNARK